MANNQQAICHSSFSIVTQKPVTKCMATAVHSSKGGFGQSRFKTVPTCCTCADTFMETLSRMGWWSILLIGNGQIILNGSVNVTGHL